MSDAGLEYIELIDTCNDKWIYSLLQWILPGVFFSVPILYFLVQFTIWLIRC